MTNKRIGYFELAVVLSISYLGSIVTSIYLFFNHASFGNDAYYASWLFGASGIVEKSIPILLVALVLVLNGEGLQTLGFVRPKWFDFFGFLALTLGCYFLTGLGDSLFRLAGIDTTPRTDFHEVVGSRNVLTYVTALLNPFSEEMVVRAYTINKIEKLTNSTALAGAVSVVIQFTYHLYQGIVPATLLLLVFAAYTVSYIRYRRIWPIIASHLAFDLIGYFLHSH